MITGANPGFPIDGGGGRQTSLGALTSDAGKRCISGFAPADFSDQPDITEAQTGNFCM